MRISWLSADEIAAARQALTAGGAVYDDHSGAPGADRFVPPPEPSDHELLDWAGITEHVARAERVSQVVREAGLAGARARFAGTSIAIEVATLAAAAHEDGALGFEEVIGVLSCAIDGYVFYAPFLELMASLAGDQIDRAVQTYENFVAAYARALRDIPHGPERIGAARDGLADFYVSAGRFDDAETLFDRRHEEDQGDVAVALSASRAFLAAGSISHAVRWLGIGAVRAATLGRDELATRLRTKQERVRERLS
jgi:tetratricopeptide (TPR) repeat protein